MFAEGIHMQGFSHLHVGWTRTSLVWLDRDNLLSDVVLVAHFGAKTQNKRKTV